MYPNDRVYKSTININLRSNKLMDENQSLCSICGKNIDRLIVNDRGEKVCFNCQLSIAEKCFICTKPIVNEEILIFDENNYHSNCFNCSICQRSLINQTKIQKNNSKVICFQCYSKDFAPKCFQCLKPIPIGKLITFDDKEYHPECFRCSKCNEMIVDENVSIVSSKKYCSKCYENSFATQCDRCLKTILNERFTMFKQKKYHFECFRCFKCNEIIVDQSVSMVQGQPYCSECYSKSIAPQCVQCLKPILDEKWTLFKENKYHSQCFRCSECNEVMHNEDISTVDSKHYCSKCYEKSFAPQCDQCLNKIIHQKFRIFNGKNYHRDCFKCSHCHQTIYEDQFPSKDGKVYCFQCFEEFIAPKCVQCLKVISKGKLINYEDKKYHPECFRCFKCDQVIEQNQFNTKDSKPCCNKCSELYFTLKCFKCSKRIVDRYTKFDGNCYHIQCFNCSKCNRIIDNGIQFSNGESGIVCSRCTN